MSCIHETKNHFCYLNNKECEYPCKDFKTEKEPVNYCKFCFNARIYKATDEELMNPFNTELTDENDSSSCGIGQGTSEFRMMISSGHREPVRVEVDRWSIHMQQWVTVGKYYPKYCPECGRRLNEYDN